MWGRKRNKGSSWERAKVREVKAYNKRARKLRAKRRRRAK